MRVNAEILRKAGLPEAAYGKMCIGGRDGMVLQGGDLRVGKMVDVMHGAGEAIYQPMLLYGR